MSEWDELPEELRLLRRQLAEEQHWNGHYIRALYVAALFSVLACVAALTREYIGAWSMIAASLSITFISHLDSARNGRKP